MIVPPEEWDTFMECLRSPLPAAFRINSSSQYYLDIRSKVENDFMKTLQEEGSDVTEVEAIKPLPWYPDNLGWQSNFSRKQLRKNQTLGRFHEFLKLQNEIGNIRRLEAVSMYDEKVLPSIGNEVLKAVVAQFNADQLLTERGQVSALVRESLIRRAKDFNIELDDVAITHLSYGLEFSKAVEQKQVAQQEAERSKFVVMKAEQERRAAIIRAEGESESAKLISDATAAAGTGLIELRKIEAARENASTLARSPNVVYLPNQQGGNSLFGLNVSC